MHRKVISIIGYFAVSLISFAFAVMRIFMGYVPSSRIVKYDNITAAERPVSFWAAIIFLLLVSLVFFIWGLISALRDRKERQ